MRIKILFALLFCFFTGFGQHVLNIPVSGNSSQVRAVNLRESGIIVLDKSSEGILTIRKVDTAMNVAWETQAEIPGKAAFIDEYFDGRFLYIILEPKEGRSFIILKISSAFAAYQRFDFPLTKGFQYGFFAANDQVICLGGAVKTEPFIAILPTIPGASPKFVSGSAKGTMELQALHVTENAILTAFINNVKKTNQIIVRELDYTGKVLHSRNLVAKDDHVFLSAKYFENQDKRLLVGNYGTGKAPANGLQSSQGIFLADMDNARISYYGFARFENLFGFLNDRQKERLDKQVEKKKKKGREYTFDYRLFISGLQFKDGQTLIVGEIFQPEYRNRNYPGLYGLSPFYSSMYWGRPLYNYYWLNSPFYGYNYRNAQVFDGFKYLEGVIFAIDKDGNPVWDNSFPYKNLKYYELATHLKVSNAADHTMALYSVGSRLKVSEIDGRGNILQSNEFDPESLELQFRNKKAEFSNFEHWYDNVYFNWGVHKSGGSNTCFIQKLTP